jgi:hypothetical protein
MKRTPVTIKVSNGRKVETTVEELSRLAEEFQAVWCERRKGKRINIEYCRSGRCKYRSCPHWAMGREDISMEKTKTEACEAVMTLMNQDWDQFTEAIKRSDKGEGTMNISVKVKAGAGGRNELTVTMSFVKEKRKWKTEKTVNEKQLDIGKIEKL